MIDFLEAAEYFRLSADQDCRHAPLAVSKCLSEGLAVDVDHSASRIYFYRSRGS